MHTVEILEGVLELAANAGYQVRHEWLGGSGGGGCELRGRKVIFVDMALPPGEQLEQTLGAIRGDLQLVERIRGSMTKDECRMSRE